MREQRIEAAGRALPITRQQGGILALVVACAAGSILYKVLMHEQFGHSAAMFIGVPAVLAIALALAPNARSVTGGILKGITLALLIIAPMLGEGVVCILVAAPLFYLVGVVIGVVVDRLRERRGVTLGCCALFLLPVCLEGVVPQLTAPREQSVTVSRVIAAPAAAVEQQLSQSPAVGMPLPRSLSIGLPRPLGAWGSGLGIGASRTIHFSGAEGAPAGNLVMQVTDRSAGHVHFETVADASKLRHWLAWKSSEVEWRQIDGGHSEVTWTIAFDRELDPAWYFSPLERAAVRVAAGYLIEANAVPGASR